MVKIGDVKSKHHVLLYGVPQGSVAGPHIFTLYSSPVKDIVKRHDVSGMFYADDSQLYVSVDRNDVNPSIGELERCIKEIKKWTAENKLSLNDSKTEDYHPATRIPHL